MILLTLFAFLAGVVTILSPCILPILPIILSSSIGGRDVGKARPVGIVVGFILSFTFFTLFLSSIVRLSGISADALRYFSVFVIAGFGTSLLIPQFQILLEGLFSKLSQYVPQGNTKAGFGTGILLGLSLGLLWTPCVGPILASVIALAVTGSVSIQAFIITLAYSIGTAIPMLIIMVGGQNVLRRVPWLLSHTSQIQKMFGVVMIATALALFFNLDRKFQTLILTTFPNYGVGLTKFEDTTPIRTQLENLGGKNIQKQDIGKPMFDLTNVSKTKAPALVPGGVWFNSDPLTLEQLRGQVIVIDFWTYSCINCQRTLPYLKQWWQKYHDKGLVIIGVHSPEFEFEKNPKNVAQAIADFQLTYPIVQDNDFATWQAYQNRYWPAKYIIDKDGYIRYSHFGEGAYDQTEQVIQNLLKEAGAENLPADINNPSSQNYARTPETYLGYARIARLASREDILPNADRLYSSPTQLPDNSLALDGIWTVMNEYAHPHSGSQLNLSFEAKEVFLVMRSKGSPAKIEVRIDGKSQFFGADNHNGEVTVENDGLYKLIKLPVAGKHLLQLKFLDDNAELYAFTFG